MECYPVSDTGVSVLKGPEGMWVTQLVTGESGIQTLVCLTRQHCFSGVASTPDTSEVGSQPHLWSHPFLLRSK